MKFLIQQNLINKEDLATVKKAVSTYPHVLVDVVPFAGTILSDKKLSGRNYIPYGSTSLVEACLERKYQGLSFDLQNFDYSTYCQNRKDMLNDGYIFRLEDAIKYLEERNPSELWFTRPCKDLKEYTGTVETAGTLVEWFRDRILCESPGTYQLNSDTMIVLDTPKTIHIEYRYFIIAGKIISGSIYRYNGQPFYKEISDSGVLAEAQRFADDWLPAPNVVMDLALTDYGVKVIEFNCINSSGFYRCNIQKIFDAWWKCYNK